MIIGEKKAFFAEGDIVIHQNIKRGDRLIDDIKDCLDTIAISVWIESDVGNFIITNANTVRNKLKKIQNGSVIKQIIIVTRHTFYD